MSKPNIVFIMPDQLRADFLSCNGATFIETRHMDDLAAGGVRYPRTYSRSPICVPARATLLTGMNAIKNGVTSNGQWLRPDLSECGIRTWPEILDAAGYYTAAIGKMHFYPWDISMGFRYRVASEDKRWPHVRDDYHHYLKDRGLRKLHGNEHEGYEENRGAIVNRIPWEHSVDHFVGEQACRFIRNYSAEAPFAMMVGFPGPHCPYDPTPEYLKEFDPADMPPAVPASPDDPPNLRRRNIAGNKGGWNGVDYTVFTEAHKATIRAHYAALVKQIDHEVGQIVEALRDAGQMDNTWIILASDHGDYLGDHDLIGKSQFYEGSIHVPMIVRPAGGTEAAVYDGLIELGDVTASILTIAGCEVPAYMDSVPMPALGWNDHEVRKRVVGMTSGGWMLYDGRWKLSKYSTGDVLLHDLETDPQEQTNLADHPDHQRRYREMDAELTRAIMESVVAANRDKALDLQNALWSSIDFGKQGWRRRYPFPR